ncbi:MAG: hypothetical protein IT515_03105 [Burkholderiales bacterium]|nr:hypothetical protein [Burkholderiales bacterium]
MNRICAALLLGLLPLHASAMCYTVFDNQNRIVYRDTVTPIDLSGSIESAMQAKFPRGHLVISGADASCVRVTPASPVDTRGIAAASATR